MTAIYFVRYYQPDGKIIDERNRPLTDEGISDLYKILDYYTEEDTIYFRGYTL